MLLSGLKSRLRICMPMKRKIKALFVAEDAGGFNALSPVYEKLRSPNRVCALFGPACGKIARGSHAKFTKEGDDRRMKLEKMFRDCKPDIIVVCPGGWNMNLDKVALMLAREKGIKTLGMLDYWANYAVRYSTPGTNDLAYVPDALCAIDELCKKQMVKAGFNSRTIHITGNPNFERFKKVSRKNQSKLISFFCQPFSELKKLDKKIDCGLDEIEVLSDLILALDALGIKGKLAIKLHTRTKQEHKFDKLIKNSGREIYIDRKASAEELVSKSSFVLGMNTMVLFEAALCGKPVLSYQPNLKIQDPLVSNALGLTLAVYKKSDLPKNLRKLMSYKTSGKLDQIRQKYVYGHATQKVISLMRMITESL